MTAPYFGYTNTKANANLDALWSGKQSTMGVLVSTADPGGLNDARAQLAADDATAAGAGELVVKRGVYRVASNLTFSSAVRLLYGAVIKPDAGVTVTINGQLSAGLWKVFDVSAGGSIVFGTGVIQAILPAWWGFVADNATDSSAALQAALNAANLTYGGRVVLPYGKAYVHSASEIPHGLATRATIEILGIGCKLRTDQAISIIRRYPATQTEANTMIDARVRVVGVEFIGDGLTANQKGLQLGATYGSEIDHCEFTSLDWGLDLQFALMTHVKSSRATNCRTYGFVARIGDWTGGGNSVSESNHTRFQSCRNYALAGMTAGFYILGCNGVHLEDCITEGANPVNNVLFDANNSTTVKAFRCTNLHSENIPTGAIFKLKGNGTNFNLDGVYFESACVMVDETGGNGANVIDIRNVPFLPATTNLFNASDNASGKDWRFTNIKTDAFDPTVSTAWISGIVPFGIRVDCSAANEFGERVPAWRGNETLRHATGGVNYDKGTLAPFVEETGANDGFDLGFHLNNGAGNHKRWRRAIVWGLATAVRTVTANYSVNEKLDHTILVDTTAGNISVNLPNASSIPVGTEFVVKQVGGANNVIVNGAASIDGVSGKTWNAINQGYTFKSDGTNWWVMSAGSLGAPLTATNAGGTIPAATTQFLMPGSDIGASGTESARQFVAPRPGTLRNLYVHTTGAQPVDAAIVFTVRKNGANTGLTVTVAANAAAGTVSDTTHTVPYVAGDLISISVANASASASASIGGFSLVLD